MQYPTQVQLCADPLVEGFCTTPLRPVATYAPPCWWTDSHPGASPNLTANVAANGGRSATAAERSPGRAASRSGRAHSRFPGHALTPTGVMAIRCKQFHLPDL